MREKARLGLGSSGMANSSLNGRACWEALICKSSAKTASAKALRQAGLPACLQIRSQVWLAWKEGGEP